jgi:hypothetical protein
MRAPQLNPGGVSVKGCDIIYAPAGQAGEYSPLAVNPYEGCGHGCAYCYVPGAKHMSREKFDAGAVPRPDYLLLLEKDARKYQAHDRPIPSGRHQPHAQGAPNAAGVRPRHLHADQGRTCSLGRLIDLVGGY